MYEPEKHQNKAYSITGSEAIDYYETAKILIEELGRKITYASPSPSLAPKYGVNVRGLEKGCSTLMSLLYMMTRLGTTKKVTGVFEEVAGKKP